jgi:hypothetical protein
LAGLAEADGEGGPALLSMSNETRKPGKQPYTTPKLVTYGNITTLTQANLASGKADGGGKLKTKSAAR